MKMKWGVFWKLRGIVIETHTILSKTIPALQAEVEEIKTNHIEHLETDVSEVKTGVHLIMEKLGIPTKPA